MSTSNAAVYSVRCYGLLWTLICCTGMLLSTIVCLLSDNSLPSRGLLSFKRNHVPPVSYQPQVTSDMLDGLERRLVDEIHAELHKLREIIEGRQKNNQIPAKNGVPVGTTHVWKLPSFGLKTSLQMRNGKRTGMESVYIHSFSVSICSSKTDRQKLLWMRTLRRTQLAWRERWSLCAFAIGLVTTNTNLLLPPPTAATSWSSSSSSFSAASSSSPNPTRCPLVQYQAPAARQWQSRTCNEKVWFFKTDQTVRNKTWPLGSLTDDAKLSRPPVDVQTNRGER